MLLEWLVLVGKISINLYMLWFDVDQFYIVECDGKMLFVDVGYLYVNVLWSLIFCCVLVIEELNIEVLQVCIVCIVEQCFNFFDIVDRLSQLENLFKFKLNELVCFVFVNLQLVNGVIDFVDQLFGVEYKVDGL